MFLAIDPFHYATTYLHVVEDTEILILFGLHPIVIPSPPLWRRGAYG